MLQKQSIRAIRGRIENFLRARRKKAGLSQRDVGILLGYVDEIAVLRHERSKTLPPLLSAIGYEIIFSTPITELFPGVRESVGKLIEEQILRLEEGLQEKNKDGRRRSRLARKLAWISERRSTNQK